MCLATFVGKWLEMKAQTVVRVEEQPEGGVVSDRHGDQRMPGRSLWKPGGVSPRRDDPGEGVEHDVDENELKLLRIVRSGH